MTIEGRDNQFEPGGEIFMIEGDSRGIGGGQDRFRFREAFESDRIFPADRINTEGTRAKEDSGGWSGGESDTDRFEGGVGGDKTDIMDREGGEDEGDFDEDRIDSDSFKERERGDGREREISDNRFKIRGGERVGLFKFFITDRSSRFDKFDNNFTDMVLRTSKKGFKFFDKDT